ncbi:MAG: hypothetical protein HQM15_07005 [Deltaproteobacteria bacterium]|nr:hypothetical protein [Deltaproteobacteria bacterium]
MKTLGIVLVVVGGVYVLNKMGYLKKVGVQMDKLTISMITSFKEGYQEAARVAV